MNYATHLNSIINTVGHSFDNRGYTAFEDQAEIKALRRVNVNFTTSVMGMNAISHTIEQEAAEYAQPFRFYSAFQRFSRVKPQAERYVKILQTHNPVYLFGVPDVILWKDPNLCEVALEEPVVPGYSYLANNWFVVLHNPDYTSMALVSREISDNFNAPERPLSERRFEGFWTYDKRVVNQVVAVLDSFIGERVSPAQPEHSDQPDPKPAG